MPIEPVRIQLSRRSGWRKPHGAVVVSRPSKWGNPFLAGAYDGAAGAVREFRLRLVGGELSVKVEDVTRELRGKDLCCWCPPDEPCHADVLLGIANR